MFDKTKVTNLEVKKENGKVTVSLTMPPHKKGERVVKIDNKNVLDFLLKECKIKAGKVLSGATVNNDYAGKAKDFVAKGTWVFELPVKKEVKKKVVKKRKPLTPIKMEKDVKEEA